MSGSLRHFWSITSRSDDVTTAVILFFGAGCGSGRRQRTREPSALILRNIFDAGQVATLQDPQVSNNGPAIFGNYVRSIRAHQVFAERDRVENLAVGLLHHAPWRFGIVQVG